MLKIIKISKEEICNLSRMPCAINDNPCYLTALQLLKSKIALEDSALYKHHKSFNLKTLYDIYGSGEKLKQYSFKSIFLPWIHTEPVIGYEDVAFMQRDEGFVKDQIEKIKRLISSIKETGYKPEKFVDRKKGHITGYFLESENKKKFYVVSGNHRASVYSALFPKKRLPIIYEEKGFMKPRDRASRTAPILEKYSYKNINQWPAVTSGFVNKNVALKILERYTNV